MKHGILGGDAARHFIFPRIIHAPRSPVSKLDLGELNLAVGGMNITVDRSGDLEWILTRGSDTAEMIWLRLLEVFVITRDMADCLVPEMWIGSTEWGS